MKSSRCFLNLSLFLFISNVLHAQIKSDNGYGITTHGKIRALIVFAEKDYSLSCGNGDPYPINPEWLPGQLPNNAANLFDADLAPGQLPTPGTITDYYFQGSMGNLTILGDYFPSVVSIPCNQYDDQSIGGIPLVINYLNNLLAPIISAHGHTLNDFDLWENNISNTPLYGLSKQNTSNQKIDLLIIYWRNPSYNGVSYWMCGSGFGVNQNGSYFQSPIQNQSVNLNFKIGYENITSFGACSDASRIRMSAIEILHGLFGGNNWHSSGGASEGTFLATPTAYCTTSQYDISPMCAFDRYHLGWKNISKNELLSATDATSQTEVPTDLSINGSPNGGDFILKDFYKTSDAIRLKLPHLNWTQLGDVKNQYMWIQNHQKISDWDHHHHENSGIAGNTPMNTGLQIMLQVGKDHTSPQFGTENIFNADPSTGNVNGLASWIFPLSAEGTWDYHIRTDLQFVDGWGHANYPVDKLLSKPNPLTGFQDQYNIIFDGTSNSIGHSEVQNGVVVWTESDAGDNKDNFSLAGNKKIGIGTNPSTATVYTYRSNSYNQTLYPNNKPSWENETIYLNNLSVKIIAETPNTQLPLNHDGNVPVDIKVRVKWDDGDIDNDIRWCGNVVLQDDVNDPLNRHTKINLKQGKNIWLMRGLSATQHLPESDGLYTKPTKLTLKNGTQTSIETLATLSVRDNSTLLVENGAFVSVDGSLTARDNSALVVKNGASVSVAGTLTVFDNSVLIAENGASISVDAAGTLEFQAMNVASIFKQGSTIHLKQGAHLIVKNNSTLKIEQGAIIQVDNSASIEIETGSKLILEDGQVWLNGTNAMLYNKGTLEIPSGTNLTLNGTGFYRFGLGNQLLLGAGSMVDIAGQSSTHKIIEIDANASLTTYQHNLFVKHGTIQYGQSAVIKSIDNQFNWEDIVINTNNTYTYNQYALEGIAARGKLEGCVFKNCQTAVYLHNNPTDCSYPPSVLIRLCVFDKNGTHIQVSDLANTTLTIQYSSFVNQTNFTGNAIELTNCNKVVVDGCTILGMSNDGIFAQNVNQLIIHGGQLHNNKNALEVLDANVYLNGGAQLYDNINDGLLISTTTSSTSPASVTIGDWGCASIFNNTNIGIEGTNFLLTMDAAYLSVLNRTGIIQPNSMYSNLVKDINITYTYSFWSDPATSLLLANTTITNNYWGGGNANWNVNFLGLNGLPMINAPFSAPFMDDNPIVTSAPTNCIFGSDPGIDTYNPTTASFRLSNTPVTIPEELNDDNTFPPYAPAGSVLAEVYRRMLNNTVTEAMLLLTDYLAAADPLTTPDNQFASTQALAANLANQLYQLDPCTDGGGFGSSERLAQVKQLKEKITTASQKALPKSSILLYPNPFTDNTTLLFSNDQKETFQLTVVDAFGKVVYQEMNITGTKLQLTNQHLAAGVYSIQLNSLNHHYSTTMEILKQ